jgi:hypothetical protein
LDIKEKRQNQSGLEDPFEDKSALIVPETHVTRVPDQLLTENKVN